MWLFASVCAMAFTILFCRVPRNKWPLALERLLLNVKYSALANKEMLKDWIEAKYNKEVTCLQTGRIAIVTGGARGIGVQIVKRLLELDMNVIIACRNPAAGNATISEIRRSGIERGNAKVYVLDNSSMESVKKFTNEIKKDFEKVHVLINNAGVMFCPYEETVDGFERHWAVNYLSHFLLTSLLLPLLNAGGTREEKSRVVNVSSCAHLLGKIDFDDISTKNRFLPQAAYAQSKLAQIVITKRLQKSLTEKNYNVEIFSVHPGLVQTDIFINSFLWTYKSLTYYLFKSPEQGALPIIYTALCKELEGRGGAYISNSRDGTIHPTVTDSLVQDKLLKLSLEQLQLKDFFQYELQQ